MVNWRGAVGVGLGLGLVLGTARPSRDPRHLAALLNARLDTIDPGLGVEDMILAAFAVEPLPPEQLGFAGAGAGGQTDGLAPLLDRLGNRLGLDALSSIETRESHIPERAAAAVPLDKSLVALTPRARAPTNTPPRPIRLFEPPQPVAAFWLLPDDPPFRFTWRRQGHRVSRADGPERIAEEWWRPTADPHGGIRDYYRVEDEDGRRFWLFRAGLADGDHSPRWYVHGVFP